MSFQILFFCDLFVKYSWLPVQWFPKLILHLIWSFLSIGILFISDPRSSFILCTVDLVVMCINPCFSHFDCMNPFLKVLPTITRITHLKINFRTTQTGTNRSGQFKWSIDIRYILDFMILICCYFCCIYMFLFSVQIICKLLVVSNIMPLGTKLLIASVMSLFVGVFDVLMNVSKSNL